MKRLCTVTLAISIIASLSLGGAHTRAAPARGPAAATKTAALLVVGSGAVHNLNPTKETQGSANELHNIGLENLLKLGKNGAPAPNLAQSVKHPNAVTYIYTLRKGVKFWDGTQLTSADVANAMSYYATPPAQTASYYKNVDSITATGKYTVVVKLKQADASWQFVPTYVAQIFEKAFFDAHKDTMGQPGALPIGTGPWKFDSFDPTSGAELSANTHWWGGKVLIKHITFKFFADETSLALAFRAGQIDLAFPLDGPTFATTAGARIIAVPSCAVGFVSMNTQVAPWNDVHVRRAVAYATDRAAIAASFNGAVSPLTQLITPEQMQTLAPKTKVTALYKSLPSYTYNLTKAKRELAQSAFPNGFSATVYSTTAVGGLDNTNQILASDLQKIGINLTVTDESIGAWVADFYAHKPIMGTGSGCGTIDPSWYPGVFLNSANAPPGGTNVANYNNPSVDNLIHQALATNNKAKRFADYSKILKIIDSDVPYDMQYVRKLYLALSRKFTDPTYNAFSINNSWPLGLEPK